MNFEFSILSFIACLGTAGILAQSRFFSFLDDRVSRFDTIDGLRGFLALSVMFHHFVITYYWKLNGYWDNPPEKYYENYGKVGVAIFFIITGFLFTSKLLKSKGHISWLKIYESRIFRIIPLYLFSVLCIVFIVFHNTDWQLASSPGSTLIALTKWFTFHGGIINDFPETRRIIAGVDWTLKYEWLFYLSLPLLAFTLYKGKRLGAFALLMFSFFSFLYPFSFIAFSSKYFILFAIGGAVSGIIRYQNHVAEIMRAKPTSLLTLALVFFSLFYPGTLDLVHIIAIGILFVMVAMGNDIFGILRSKQARLLGEISYSIYLLHGITLYVLFTQSSLIIVPKLTPGDYMLLMPFVGIVVVSVAAITFLLIEKPFITFGHRHYFSMKIMALLDYVNKTLHRKPL